MSRSRSRVGIRPRTTVRAAVTTGLAALAVALTGCSGAPGGAGSDAKAGGGGK
ncbi:hypothetical protein [Streptomyces sp. NPDC002133]|uniref:hypothetical protein n=1 Tax=Streptomyces sp. NPDC002133 TaxID=3154409 RepID=UPI0033307180